MNVSEIRPCDLCGEGLCADGHVTFNKVQFQHYGVDRHAVMDRVGLAHLFHGKASAQLIEVFAPSRDVAVLITEPADLFICETCAMGDGDRRALPVMALAEIAQAKLDERKAAARKTMETSANDD